MNNFKEIVQNFNENTTLKEIQEYTKNVIISRGFGDETPHDIMLLLTEELGELAKEVRKTTHIKMDSKDNRISNIEKELADVFNYVLAMAISLDIDMLKAVKDKELINCDREWK